MQTWEAITSRRNVRYFAGRPIPAADLDQILEAGRRWPCARAARPRSCPPRTGACRPTAGPTRAARQREQLPGHAQGPPEEGYLLIDSHIAVIAA
jgi:hypothetical protein